MRDEDARRRRRVEDVAAQAEAARRAALDDGEDLRDLEDGAAGDHAEPEALGEGELEAALVGEVRVPDEGRVALLRAQREREGVSELP